MIKNSILKLIVIWVICSIMGLFTFKEVRPDKKITLGHAVFIVTVAPISAIAGSMMYLFSADFWDKCIIGCDK
jgi:hypothetical protein